MTLQSGEKVQFTDINQQTELENFTTFRQKLIIQKQRSESLKIHKQQSIPSPSQSKTLIKGMKDIHLER